MKIWFKLFDEDSRILSHYIVENTLSLSRANYESTVQVACYEMDIGCPLQLTGHFKHFSSYNTAKYLSTEFVETCNFHHMTTENITVAIEKKSNR